MAFTDTTLMPFGKYKNKPLVEVPDNYLLWLYENGLNNLDLKAYIEDNMAAIKLKIRNDKRD